MNQKREQKRIVYIINSFEVGGAERFLIDLATSLASEKYEVSVICVIKEGELSSKIKEKNIRLYVIGKRSKIGFLSIIRMWRILSSIKPHIVHTMLFGGDLWGRIAAILARVPTIITTEQNVHTVDRFIEHWSKRILNHWTKNIVFISNAVKQYYMSRVPVAEEKTVIIPNGSNLSEFLFSRPQGLGHKPVISCIGRLVEQKGHTYLFHALSALQNREWECWLIGDGELRESLEKECLSLGLTKRVKFWGTRRDIPELLKESDIVVLPSIYEGQGIALVEAAAAKTFIVASNTGGIAEMFQHHRTAFLTSPRDPNFLISAFEWYFNNRELAYGMASSAQKMVIDNYSIEAISEKYQELYENTSYK